MEIDIDINEINIVPYTTGKLGIGIDIDEDDAVSLFKQVGMEKLKALFPEPSYILNEFELDELMDYIICTYSREQVNESIEDIVKHCNWD